MVAKRIGATATLAVAFLLAAVVPAFAAIPGDVLYVDQVFKSGVVGDDTGVDVKVDSADNPIIAAKSATGLDAQEYLYWSYTPTGLWRGEGHWNGTGSTFETVNGQALDGGGRSLVVGSTTTAAGGDMYLVCRDNDGTFAWQDTYNGPANSNDEAMAVAVDPVGDVCYTGMSQDADGDPHGLPGHRDGRPGRQPALERPLQQPLRPLRRRLRDHEVRQLRLRGRDLESQGSRR